MLCLASLAGSLGIRSRPSGVWSAVRPRTFPHVSAADHAAQSPKNAHPPLVAPIDSSRPDALQRRWRAVPPLRAHQLVSGALGGVGGREPALTVTPAPVRRPGAAPWRCTGWPPLQAYALGPGGEERPGGWWKSHHLRPRPPALQPLPVVRCGTAGAVAARMRHRGRQPGSESRRRGAGGSGPGRLSRSIPMPRCPAIARRAQVLLEARPRQQAHPVQCVRQPLPRQGA